MDLDRAQGFLRLAWSAALSWEPQAAVPALRGAPGLSQGHRDGGEDWECPSHVTIPDEQLLAPVTDQQHRDNSVGPELLLFSFALLDS